MGSGHSIDREAARVLAEEMLGPVPTSLTVMSHYSLGVELAAIGGTPGSAKWPTANVAILVPFVVRGASATAKRLFWRNGNAVSGNVCMAVYDADLVQLVTTGSTPQAGVAATQIVDTTNVVLAAGRYYMGLAVDNITATTQRWGPDIESLRALGVAQQAAAFPLPNPFVPAAITDAYLPMMGIEFGRVVGGP